MATIARRIEADLRRRLREWAAADAAWEDHHATCPLCFVVRTGAARRCAEGRQLRRATRETKRGADMIGEDAVHVFGRGAVEAVARVELADVCRRRPEKDDDD
jgi:hypothetical protein